MSLIKGQLAQELSKASGETMTEAVTVVLRERMVRLCRSRKADATAAELLAIGTRRAASLTARTSKSRYPALRGKSLTQVIVDTCAVFTILFAEPDAERYARAIRNAPV